MSSDGIQPGRKEAEAGAEQRDGDREFDYTAGAEKALERANTDGWTVVSMKQDWTAIF